MLPREGKSLGRGTRPLHFPEEGPGAAALLLCTGCTSQAGGSGSSMVTSSVGWALPRDYRESLDPVAWSLGRGMCGEREVTVELSL